MIRGVLDCFVVQRNKKKIQVESISCNILNAWIENEDIVNPHLYFMSQKIHFVRKERIKLRYKIGEEKSLPIFPGPKRVLLSTKNI